MTELEQLKVIATHLGDKARVMTADLAGAGQTGNDEGAEQFSDEEVFQPLGFAARPVCGEHTEAIALRVGDQQFVLVIVDKGQALYTAAPGALEEGETRVSGAKEVTACIRVRASGKIEITALSGQDIVLNGGTLKVARDTDGVNKSSSMTAWMTQVETAVNTLLPGSVTTLSAPPGGFTQIGNISGGATHTKA